MEIKESYDVIALPLRSNSNDGGLVQIAFYYDEDGVIQPLDPRIFSKKLCWIINGYQNEISEKFPRNSFFRLNGITKTRFTNEEDRLREDFAEWCCNQPHNKVSKLTNELMEVIECELPDKDSGEIKNFEGELSRGTYFIKNNNHIYGPFDVTIGNNNEVKQYFASPSNTPSVPVPSHHLTKVSYELVEDKGLVRVFTKDDFQYTYIVGLKTYVRELKDVWDVIDYISASDLMKFVSKYQVGGGKRLMTNNVLTQVKAEIEKVISANGSKLQDKERFFRAISLLSRDEENKSKWYQLLDDFFGDDGGKRTLQSYVSQSMLQKARDELLAVEEMAKQKRSDVSQLEVAIKNIEASKHSLQEDLKELEEKLNITQEQIEHQLEAKSIDLQKEIKVLEANKLNLEQQTNSESIKLRLLNDVDSITKEKEELERTRFRAEEALSKVKTAFSSPATVIEKLTDLEIMLSLMGYSQKFIAKDPEKINYISAPKIKVIEPNEELARNIVYTLTDRISGYDAKELSELEVANILIALTQNFLTFFQGKPGVGKTSTAINLAKAMRIHGTHDFINISVARGWTGSRDLLGFYNGLRGEYQPSGTGLYDFLIRGEQAGDDSNFRIALLDEANLSPIEHYWSDFIGLTDKEGMGQSISTNQNGEYKYIYPAKNGALRFIGTINNDGTTESLSPRIISRAPIISMDANYQNNSLDVGGSKLGSEGAFLARDINKLFGRDSILKTDKSSGEAAFDELLKIIQPALSLSRSLHTSLGVDGRKKQSIISYLDVANTIMPDSAAQDFALAQFILPALKADGDNSRLAIDTLIEQAANNSFDLSRSILQLILHEGDDYLHHYSFM